MDIRFHWFLSIEPPPGRFISKAERKPIQIMHDVYMTVNMNEPTSTPSAAHPSR
jgi:hypothetical protein